MPADTAVITFTLDVEDHMPAGTEPRAVETTREILAFLHPRHVRGTFFVVGALAATRPQLVRAIAQAGHEVGLHGWHHEALTEIEPARFRRETIDGKALLEDLTGIEVIGYRAPTFSLVPATEWVTDVLAELGFEYSSSVLPARSMLFGWPEQSRVPFRWPCGLVELPCPVARLGPVTSPYLGGLYLRVLPESLIRAGLRRAGQDEVLWSYCHPYDFDPDEPFTPRADMGSGRWKSRIQWLNRRRMYARVGRLLDHGSGPPLRERASVVLEHLRRRDGSADR